MSRYIGAIDQGTTSTRFMIFDRAGAMIGSAQREHRQIFPQPGWVEHDALEIWSNTQIVIDEALRRASLTPADLAAVGITNQRETTVVWNHRTGTPIYNAIVWQDTRVERRVAQYAKEGGQDRFRAQTGLPLASYFSALKLQWLLDEVAGARAAAESGELLFGTMDTWLLWNLTGGPSGGLHLTDVSNASRTQLFNLHALAWDADLIDAFRIPAAVLPTVVSSSEVYGAARIEPLRGVNVAGILGDQQAALVGQACLSPGAAKNTYGTGCFLLLNTGEQCVASKAGLVTTVAYRFGKQKAHYALEGSIAVTGSLVQWLRDNLGLIGKSEEVETLAHSVEDNGDVYFVPAFSGLYAPHWDESARGIVAGLTRFANRGHVARAALEATAFQTQEVLEAMRRDSGVRLGELRVDGGMVVNELLMQFQADILDATVVRPQCKETTVLGAAYAAGLAVGYWESEREIVSNWQSDKRWQPMMSATERQRLLGKWAGAVQRSRGWIGS